MQPQKCHAKVAQLVEHDLAKVGVAGPNPVFRSTTPDYKSKFSDYCPAFFTGNALVVELVDTQDLKSCDFTVVRVQVPPGVQQNQYFNL